MHKTSRQPAEHRAPRPDAATADALVTDISRRIARALEASPRPGDDAADGPALSVPPSRVPLAPARLAAGQPGGSAGREQAQRLYQSCLDHYRRAVRPQDSALGLDDVGAAAAHFVAACLEALQGTRTSGEGLLRLERQLAQLVRLSPAWAGARARDRQMVFEQMALLAVLIDATRTRAAAEGTAAVENVRRAARGYLQQLLGLDPDVLALGPQGLMLQPRASIGRHAA
jgi:hypothetical protein